MTWSCCTSATGPDYAEHIPGARLIAEDDVSRPHNHSNLKDMMLELPDAATLRAKISALGISDTSRIVVYFGKDTPLQSATRIVFTLDYLGLGSRTSLLNGGFAAWKRAGKPVTAAIPAPVRGTLTAPTRDALVADAAFVDLGAVTRPGTCSSTHARRHLQGHRADHEREGRSHSRREEHSLHRDDRYQHDDRPHPLAAVFARAGVKPGDTVVAYCHVGQQATAVLFAARLLGHPVVLYDGSFQDWAVNNRGAVEK